MKKVAAYALLAVALGACSDAPTSAPTSAPATAPAPGAASYAKGGDPIPNSYIVVYRDNVRMWTVSPTTSPQRPAAR